MFNSECLRILVLQIIPRFNMHLFCRCLLVSRPKVELVLHGLSKVSPTKGKRTEPLFGCASLL